MGDAAVMAGHPWVLLPGFIKWGVVGRERGIGEGGRGRGLVGEMGGSKRERMGESMGEGGTRPSWMVLSGGRGGGWVLGRVGDGGDWTVVASYLPPRRLFFYPRDTPPACPESLSSPRQRSTCARAHARVDSTLTVAAHHSERTRAALGETACGTVLRVAVKPTPSHVRTQTRAFATAVANDQCVIRAVRRPSKRGRATECALPAHARPLRCDLLACSRIEGLVGRRDGCGVPASARLDQRTEGSATNQPPPAAVAPPQGCHQDLHLSHGVVEQRGACDLLSRH